MSFNSFVTPITETGANAGTLASQEDSPLTYFWKHIKYDVIEDEEDVGTWAMISWTFTLAVNAKDLLRPI